VDDQGDLSSKHKVVRESRAGTRPASSRAARLAAAIVPYHGAYAIRGRWLTPGYNGLRNAAWACRNSRAAADLNPLALRLVVAEAEALVRSGEQLADVLEAFAELLMKP
jgi:hypothetical protein